MCVCLFCVWEGDLLCYQMDYSAFWTKLDVDGLQERRQNPICVALLGILGTSVRCLTLYLCHDRQFKKEVRSKWDFKGFVLSFCITFVLVLHSPQRYFDLWHVCCSHVCSSLTWLCLSPLSGFVTAAEFRRVSDWRISLFCRSIFCISLFPKSSRARASFCQWTCFVILFSFSFSLERLVRINK